jgi:cbb3-type cytochrome oxidase maturation protein
MNILLLLIPFSILLAAIGLWACIASIRSGQYKDLESPKWRMLFDQPLNQNRDQK